MKYIIDTDPGIDDAIAIVMAYLSGLDIIGFTLTSGNNSLEKVTRNMKVIEDFLDCDIKIYKGKEKNSVSALYAHGDDGLGNFNYECKKRNIEKMSAEDFIIDSAKKYDDLSIVCLGPLTNLAYALKKDKSITKKIKKIYIMGTTTDENYLEFNVSSDPESFKAVINYFDDVSIISHDVALKTVCNIKRKNTKINNFIYEISKQYLKFNKEKYNIDGLTMPDPLVVASIINPKIVTFEKATIDVDEMGRTFVKIGEGNINYSISSNLKEFSKLFDKLI